MKTRGPLIASVLLNVILIAVAASLWQRAGTATDEVRTAPVPAAGTNRPTPASSKAAPAPAAIPDRPRFDWQQVESENYRQYIANLRSIGCPEETIRDIIVADVNKLFDARRSQLYPSTNKFEYWKGGNFLAGVLDESRMEREKALKAEKRALLKALLGVDVPDSPDLISGAKFMETMLDFLPGEKQTQLMELEQTFAAKMAKNMKALQRGDTEALRALQAEKDAEMLKILSPDEKFEYDLRMSQTAMIMRMQMGDVEVSEQEFRDLFRLRKSFEDEHGGLGIQPNNPEAREQRAAAQRALDAQVRDVVGEPRFLEMKFANDFERSSLKNIAQEHNVPRQSALKVYEIRDVAQQEAARIRQDASLAPEQRQAKLEEIQAATALEVRNLIGQGATDAYLDKGSWLKNLSRGN